MSEILEVKGPGFGSLLIDPGTQQQLCEELFGSDIWVLESQTRKIMATKHEKGNFHSLFVRKEDARLYALTFGRTAQKIGWDEIFEICTWDGQLAIEIRGPYEVLRQFRPAMDFIVSEYFPAPSNVRREHIEYGVDLLRKARRICPDADLSIWTPLSMCCALDNELPSGYRVELKVPMLFMVAHPYSTNPLRQNVQLVRQDENGSFLSCHSDGSETPMENEDNWARQCVAWMGSPFAAVERVRAKHKMHRGRNREVSPEYVTVQRRSVKYFDRQPVDEDGGERGTHSSPRFEFVVTSHVRLQPYRSFGKDENGEWNCVKEIIIPSHTRCRGKERPIVVSKVTR